MTESNYIFNSVHTVAAYLFSKKEDISPLKLQKSLYFLFAYHSALYDTSNQEGKEGIIEGLNESPQFLFDAQFEAWKFGPVIREVYVADKYEHIYEDKGLIDEAVKEVENLPEIKKFIDDLFEQIDSVSDFSLVERSHNDDAWKIAYDTEEALIDHSIIIKEYKEKYGN
ncbi:DUF4065 domain-containing protein [Bacillaceae bacterium IKA-2]|nr:DUF4065 domain-containing protein [Bacillaceae bacterium IKA-2]